VLAELREQVGELIDWRAGFLGADGPKGVSKIAEQTAELRDQVVTQGDALRNLAQRVSELSQDVAGADRAWQGLADRVSELVEWRQAELDPDNLGTLDSLLAQVADLRMQVEQVRMRDQPASRSVAGTTLTTSAPHVLGLIAQLQKRVAEIGKGREFKAENNRGTVTQQYDFRGIEDAQNAIGSVQREIGLIGPAVTVLEKVITTAEVNKGSYTQVMTTVSVTNRYTFQSPVDGSTWSTEGCGMGRDAGDKAESKALAGAFKYALFHGLNIPVKGVSIDAETDDPRIERENVQREQRGYAQDRVDRDAGRTYGSGEPQRVQAPQDWVQDDGRKPDPRPDERAVQQQPTPMPAGTLPPKDPRSPEELARDAITAVRRASSAVEAAKMWNWVYQQQCLTVPVDGVPVGQHMLAAIRLLPGGDRVELPGWGQFR
jgi:uncharacterized protein YoxC